MTAPAEVPFYAVNDGISLGEAIHISRAAYRCTCSRENGTCPRHEAEIEAAEWHGGDYEPTTEGDWDAIEAGELWGSYPGMGSA